MSLILSGTDGLSDIDGSAATPAIRGTDANTGIFFGTDTVGISTGGTSALSISASQVVTLTNALPVASGGTGGATYTANNVLLGNGTSAFQTVAPGTNGNLLTSNGTTWTSAAAPSGMVYPGSGIANSTGSAWGTSYSTTGTGTVVALATSPTLTTPNIDSAQVATVSGTAPLYFARAWVNFNGTGTIAIRASGNVSSLTDNGTGNYSVNFATAMTDANYAAVVTQEEPGAIATCSGNFGFQQTAGVGRIGIYVGTGSGGYDPEQVNYVVLR
jgi:hypothetical protein